MIKKYKRKLNHSVVKSDHFESAPNLTIQMKTEKYTVSQNKKVNSKFNTCFLLSYAYATNR